MYKQIKVSFTSPSGKLHMITVGYLPTRTIDDYIQRAREILGNTAINYTFHQLEVFSNND